MCVFLGPLVLWLCGGRRRLFRSWPPWSPLPLPPLFGFLPSFFFCVCVRVVRGLPLLRRGRALACPGCLFLWSFGGCVVLVAAFSGSASSGWAGWSPGVLSAVPVGVAFGMASLGGCRPGWSGCAASRLCDFPPHFPCFPLAGGCALVGGWGLPPFVFFFGGGFACSFLCLPWAGARTCRQTVWLTGSWLAL